MKGQIALIFFTILNIFMLNYCSDPGLSLQVKLDNKIESNQLPDSPLNFKIVKFDKKVNHATLEIECDFNQVDSETYLNQLSKVERILFKEGIKDIKYQIVNRPGSSSSLKSNLLDKQYPANEYKNTKSLKPIDTGFDLGKLDFTKVKEKNQIKINKGVKQKVYNLLPYKRGQINYNFLRLRKDPTTASPIVTYLFKDTVVKLKEKSKSVETISNNRNYWYLIETKDHKKGWVFGRYLSKTGEKHLSSSIQNNLIYRDFIKKKNLLLPKEFQPNIKSPKKKINILAKKLFLTLGKSKILEVPFKINGTHIQWQVNEIKLKKLYSKAKRNYTDPAEEFFPEDYPRKSSNRNELDSTYGTSEYDYPEFGLEQKSKKKTRSDLIAVSPEGLKNYSAPSGRGKPHNFTQISPKQENQRQITVSPAKNYMLKIVISEYLKQQLIPQDLNMTYAIKKVIEGKLFGGSYNKDVKFHRNFNIFYDTIVLTIQEIDFDRKIAAFEIRRIQPNPTETGPRQVAFDRWVINFQELKNTTLNYDRMDELMYSEIRLAIDRAGGRYSKQIVGISNYVVELLLKQKYI